MSCCRLIRGKLYLANPFSEVSGSQEGWGDNYSLQPWGGFSTGAATPSVVGARFVGNASQIDIIPETETFDSESYTGTGEGECSAMIIKNVNVEVTLHCSEIKNLIMMMNAKAVELAGGQKIEEYYGNFESGQAVFVGGMISETSATVVEYFDGITTTLITEYEASTFAITLKNPLTGSSGAYLRITYDSDTHCLLDTYQPMQQVYSMIFDGINIMDDQPHLAIAYRAKLLSLPTIQEIGKELQAYQVTFRLLPVKINGKMTRLHMRIKK